MGTAAAVLTAGFSGAADAGTYAKPAGTMGEKPAEAWTATTVAAGGLNVSAYAIALADGSINVVLVNKDGANGVNASVDVGSPLVSATGAYLLAPALNATTDVTFSGAPITPTGDWSPRVPYNLPVTGSVVTVDVPPAAAVLVRAR